MSLALCARAELCICWEQTYDRTATPRRYLEERCSLNTKLVKLIPLLVIAIGILVSAGLYLALVSANCDTSGAAELIGDFRDFHSHDGC